ncbi:MAG TPA: methylated-DNA--[protein]-cysteine S-methyltransferase [Steroidobacteraceae bacterium]|nr:methylated-DNA--[protein]-cysteine S-methyltransferase [Steroidobacteraceae bacterium]
MTTPIYWHEIDSPIGRLLLAGERDQLTLVRFQSAARSRRPQPEWVADAARFDAVTRQLSEYFAGERQVFDLELAMAGTPFQRAVWSALREIPYGETISYGELARRLGRPRAVRAVGSANGANPVPIIVPCHRVIGSDGSLTGFGGGLDMKRRLLALEGAACVDSSCRDLFAGLPTRVTQIGPNPT